MIRYAREDELNSIKNIWNYCFNDEESFVNYYFKNKYKSCNTVVYLENNKIISSLQLNNYKININNKTYDTSYVVGVSTFPEGRGRGFMKDIMSFSLNELYNKKHLVSILMPIDFRIYERFGYTNCYDILEYEIDINDIDNFRVSGSFYEANEENINELIEIQNDFLKNNNGNIVRDKDYYKNFLEEVKSENGYIYINDGEGYLTYFINNNEMFVREIYYKNINSLKSMLGFIYNHNTQINKVKITTPINDKIRFILKNPKHIKINLKQFMMGRVINVFEFLKTLNLDNKSLNKDLKTIICIKDRFIKENNKLIEIKIEKNELFINEIKENYNNKDVDFIDINSFSKLCFSYLDIDELIFNNNLELSKNTIDIFNILFNKKINYINEYV